MSIPASQAVLLAFIPIFWLLAGLAVFRFKPVYVCSSGLALSVLLACLFWDFSPGLAGLAVADGAIFAVIPILWVIAAAFFTYNVSVYTGADKRIRELFLSISPDSRIQVLVIAFGLGSFMEAVAGFGTSVVIPAVILISLGFKPLLTAILCQLSSTIAIAFGVIGIPIQTLAWVTDLDVFALSSASVIQRALLTVMVPYILVLCLTRSWKRTLEVWFPALLCGLVFVAVQYLVSSSLGPELATVAASICSTLAVVLAIRLFPVKSLLYPCLAGGDNLQHEPEITGPSGEDVKGAVRMVQVKAWSPYIILFLLVIVSSVLVPPVHDLLARLTTTLLVYTGPGGKALTISWLTTPGTLVLIAAVSGGLWQGAKILDLFKIYGETLRQIGPACITIISIVCMAKVLSYSGMMLDVSAWLAYATGSWYPAFSPSIGALGAFITSSDTSANILFGGLQKQVALQIGLDPVWIAAANFSGASIGKLLSPQNISLVAVAAGLAGQEGKLLGYGLAFAVPFLVLLGALVFMLS